MHTDPVETPILKGYAPTLTPQPADDWYATNAKEAGLATQADLDAMEAAWREWSGAADAYAAFAWCRAVGRKPITAS
jgi:hypothetical protein